MFEILWQMSMDIEKFNNEMKIIYRCTSCENRIRRKFVLLHACSMNETIDCLCQTCYEEQYPTRSESDENQDEPEEEEENIE